MPGERRARGETDSVEFYCLRSGVAQLSERHDELRGVQVGAGIDDAQRHSGPVDGDRTGRDLRLLGRLAGRLLPSVRFVGRTLQLLQFARELPAPRTQVLFLRPQFIQHGDEVLLGQPLKGVGSLGTNLRDQGEAENHKDDEHDGVQAARQREEGSPGLRPQAPAAPLTTRLTHPRGSFIGARPVLLFHLGAHIRPSKADGEWTRCWRRSGCPTQRQRRSSWPIRPRVGFPGTPGGRRPRHSKRRR